MKKICKLGLVFILMFTLVLSNISFSNYVFALKDVSDSLKILSKSVYQGGIKVNDGKQIDTNQPITVEFEIGVPVKGDSPVPPKIVEHNDFANLEVGEGITLQGTSVKEFKTKGIKQATATFSNDASGKAKINIKFDGDKNIYNGGWQNVKMKISATYKVDTTKAKNPDGTYSINIFGTIYKARTPITVKELTKQGYVDVKDHTVQWTVKFKTDGGSVSGLKLLDELKNVGPYVDGSFSVDNTYVSPNYNKVNQELRYTFTQSYNSVTVRFKTQLTPLEFRSKDRKIKKVNKVQILNSQNAALSSATGEAQWSPGWISKGNEKVQQAKGGFATWVIEFNRLERATLKNVVIEDVLRKSILTNKKQEFDSATIEKFDGTVYGAPMPITPQQSKDKNGNSKLKFNIPKVDDGIRIKIKVKVDNDLDINVSNRYQNVVYAGWDGVTGDNRATASSSFTIR